jgi:hypothetical protein
VNIPVKAHAHRKRISAMPDNIGRKAPSRWPSWLPYQVALSEVQNPALRKGLDLWTVQKGTRRMPSREEMTPRDMSEFLRNVVLVKVLDHGKEFEFRIVGDAIVVVQGVSFRGKTTREVEVAIPGYGDALREAYSLLCQRAEPIAFRGTSETGPRGKPFVFETLLLPLGANDATVDHLIVIAFYSFDPGSKGT